MCFVRPSCLAWSFVNLTDGSSECRLADSGPSAHLVEDNTDAVYFFLQGEASPGVASRPAVRGAASRIVCHVP